MKIVNRLLAQHSHCWTSAFILTVVMSCLQNNCRAEFTEIESPIKGFSYLSLHRDPFSGDLEKVIHEDFIQEAEYCSLECDLSPEMIRSLGRLKSLRSVTLKSNLNHEPPATVTAAIEQLGHLDHLQEFMIQVSFPEETSWNGLRNLRSLRSLIISSMDGTLCLRQGDLNAIGELTELRNLVLSTQIESQDYSWLKNLDRLEYLMIQPHKTKTSQFFEVISQHKNLLSLQIEGHPLKQNDLESLSKGLGQQLKLLDCRLQDPSITAGFSNFKTLTALSLSVDVNRDCKIEFAKDLPHLERLNIQNGFLTLEQVRKLQGHPELKYLAANYRELNPDYVEAFLAIPHLEKVVFRTLTDSQSEELIQMIQDKLEQRQSSREPAGE